MCLQTKLENLQNLKPQQLKAKVPSWAKPTPMPRSTIKPHLECEFPAWTKRTAPVIVPCKIPCVSLRNLNLAPYSLTSRYVTAFDRLNNLRPAPIEIVTCEAFA